MKRNIDHLVVAVRNLDAAKQFYERLGFRVGAANDHPWGTRNRIIQIGGSFLELIEVAEPSLIPEHGGASFSFGTFVRDYLARREGLAMLVLTSQDAAADARAFDHAGLGSFDPFFFERLGRRPDGSETRVAFTLAFAQDPEISGAGFFVCEHHHPENFWNPEFQRHPNGAVCVASATLVCDQPERHRRFLEVFTGERDTGEGGSNVALKLPSARLDAVVSEDAARLFGSIEEDGTGANFVAYGIGVGDLPALVRLLDHEGISYERIGSRIVVPASVAFGVAISFEPV
jgi:catechol 2,3-dioxygenase-like lactoylglutathione lyase family enzyme